MGLWRRQKYDISGIPGNAPGATLVIHTRTIVLLGVAIIFFYACNYSAISIELTSNAVFIPTTAGCVFLQELSYFFVYLI